MRFLKIIASRFAFKKSDLYFVVPNKSSLMKKRVSRILNFFAFNLLFFALYLNFIHKDSNTQPAPSPKSSTAASKGTVLVANPEQYLNKTQVKNDVQTSQFQN
jgi:hypothetical protein